MVSAARFLPQANRSELARRMDALVADRDRYLSARDHLAEESMLRFSSDLTVALGRGGTYRSGAPTSRSPPHHLTPGGRSIVAARCSPNSASPKRHRVRH